MAIGTAAGIAAGVNAIGGIAAGIAGSKISKEQARRMRDAYAEFHGIEPPSIEELAYKLEQGAYIGDLTPESFESVEQTENALESIQKDPALRQQQVDVLDKFKQMSEEGLTEADLAAARQSQRSVSADARSREKSILRQMAQRGTLGSGAELASQLGSSQSAMEQAAKDSDSRIRQVQERMYNATAKSGQLSGDLRKQDYGEESDLAASRNAIMAANLANKRATLNANVRSRNAAMASNLANRQQHEYDRAKLGNTQSQMDADLKRERYKNQLALAEKRAGILSDAAKAKAKSDASNISTVGGIIKGATDYFSPLKKK